MHSDGFYPTPDPMVEEAIERLTALVQRARLLYVVYHPEPWRPMNATGWPAVTPVCTVTLDVNVADSHPQEWLNRVFELTNNTGDNDLPFWECHTEVRLLVDPVKHPVRSTSAGDYIGLAILPDWDRPAMNFAWRVNPTGFTELREDEDGSIRERRVLR